jgi:lysophospholipase L1-like esterase
MMFRLFIASALFIFINLGCNSEELPETHQNPDQVEEKPAISRTYLALGDSYTIGQDVPETDRYPVQLKDSLEKVGIKIEKLQIIARTGWTTDELSKAMDGAELDESYDMVTLLIGVNNQYRGRSADSYRPEFVGLLQRAIKLAGNKSSNVIVLSIPDWGVTPFAQGRDSEKISAEINAYNAINKEESLAAGAEWVDVTTISREATDRPDLIANDGLHPSGVMYHYWMLYLFPHAIHLLTED